MEIHDDPLPSELMIDVSVRLRELVSNSPLTQAELARRVGITPQRLNNYLNRKGNVPDVETLARIAKALGVSIDYIVGFSEQGPVDYSPIIVRFLELAGLAPEMSAAIAEGVIEAGRIAAALPDEGDPALRSRLAAQTVWQSRGGLKPS
jgi:transcriptional regulator with XRE-family HTH domain